MRPALRTLFLAVIVALRPVTPGIDRGRGSRDTTREGDGDGRAGR
ncbi:hypothetical protein HNR72_005406 [Streptomyces collinus]|uniref:Uncharacterized protein n=1 Tax=Streptomyces collinus TaxID=42684 RepID=A0AA89U041_STRCU|nr:hypothetical protein [Streptomyces collinus]